MNTYEAIEAVYVAAVAPKYAKRNTTVEAALQVRELLNAYNSLKPSLEMWEAHPAARWYGIDGFSGCSAFFQDEPSPVLGEWIPTTGDVWEADDVVLPVGIDWRLCLFKRPEKVGNE